MKTKQFSLLLVLLVAVVMSACDKMEDNYAQYLENTKIYSPKVTDLTAVSGLKTSTLSWKNPGGNIAVKNVIFLNDSIIYLSDTLVTSYQLTNLEIKGYTVSVYTVDRYDNYSIPATVYIFPNGEN